MNVRQDHLRGDLGVAERPARDPVRAQRGTASTLDLETTRHAVEALDGQDPPGGDELREEPCFPVQGRTRNAFRLNSS